ncbi:hypothetical protein AB0M87_25040 [Streptomyces sp. NPDC051320]|uniref:hypothetical protein n=1 Tax=Streptomyces sp. NPDC051320 TaxID=3154644 RepID=UPI003418554D
MTVRTTRDPDHARAVVAAYESGWSHRAAPRRDHSRRPVRGGLVRGGLVRQYAQFSAGADAGLAVDPAGGRLRHGGHGADQFEGEQRGPALVSYTLRSNQCGVPADHGSAAGSARSGSVANSGSADSSARDSGGSTTSRAAGRAECRARDRCGAEGGGLGHQWAHTGLAWSPDNRNATVE